MDEQSKHIIVPVYIVATSPFTIIAFDDDDHLDITLDQINTHTYDHIKFCRTTMKVDGQIGCMADKNMAVIVSYTGAFIYPRIKGISKQDVIDSVNKILLKLMLGGILFDSVSREDVGAGIIYETGYFLAGGGASGKNFTYLSELQYREASIHQNIELLEPRVYTKKQISEALTKGATVLEKLPEINPSMFIDGITHYKKFQLASALSFLWSVSETIIGKIWADKVIPAGEGITHRKDFIRNIAWTAAHKAEVLYQMNIINKPLYDKLNIVRVKRNLLAHKGQTPTLEICEKAIESVLSLISLIVTGYSERDLLDSLAESIKIKIHPEPVSFKSEDVKYYRELPAVPGSKEWGDKPFLRYPEIELKRLDHSKD